MTLVTFLAFDIVTRSLQQKLSERYLVLAQNQTEEAALIEARHSLEVARSLRGDAEAINGQEQTINKIQNDDHFAYDFYSSHNNQEKASSLKLIIQPYANPKDLLGAVKTLTENGEQQSATTLIKRGETLFPAYSGLAAIKDYLNNIGGV